MPELELLRRLAPPEAAPPTRATELRARAALERRTRARSPMARRRLRWAVATPALAVAAAVLLIGGGTGSAPAPASAATVLRHAAAAALDGAPAGALGPGQYQYTESVDVRTATYVGERRFTQLVPLHREIWLGRDGRGWVTTKAGAPTWLSPRDRDAWIAAGRPPLGSGDGDEAISNGGRPTVPMRSLSLPSDPDALWARLAADAADAKGAPVHPQMFLEVADALRDTSTTPAQRAALYGVAARLPGVEAGGTVRDGVGRAGTAVSMDVAEKGIRVTLIFDPGSWALLGEATTALAGNAYDVPAGTRVGWSAYLRSAVVDRVQERP